MRSMISLALLAAIPLSLSACGGPRGEFPSLLPRPGEVPRVIEAPGQFAEPALSPEERARLAADLERESAALSAAERELESTGNALQKALGALNGSKIGSEQWSDTQLALSRYELATGPLAEIEARLTPMLRMVDSLSAENADRQAVESLASATAAIVTQARKKIEAANRALGN